jgi:hypothetical protein
LQPRALFGDIVELFKVNSVHAQLGRGEPVGDVIIADMQNGGRRYTKVSEDMGEEATSLADPIFAGTEDPVDHVRDRLARGCGDQRTQLRFG